MVTKKVQIIQYKKVVGVKFEYSTDFGRAPYPVPSTATSHQALCTYIHKVVSGVVVGVPFPKLAH